MKKFAVWMMGIALLLPAVGSARGAGLDTAGGQSAPGGPGTKARRSRLILKDGTYQLVLSYQVVGSVVRYKSAERNGGVEEVPLELVDLPATEAWVRSQGAGAGQAGRSVLSPELAKEEAERAATTPEILPGLKLPEDVSVLVLDLYTGGSDKGVPELVPLQQEGGDLNKETAHNVLKQPINPASAAHNILELGGLRAEVKLHTMMPAFYVRIGEDDEGDAGAVGGSAVVVDTHGGSGREAPTGGAVGNGYVLEKLSLRMDAREVESFRIASLGVRAQPDVIGMRAETVPGGKWLKLTPLAALEVGEYALIEVLSANDVNLGVWDFGVHPEAKENVEAMRPQAEKAVGLERRGKE